MKRLRNSFIKWLFVCLICLVLGFLLGKFQQDLLNEKLLKVSDELQTQQDANAQLQSDLSSFQVNASMAQQTIKSLLQSNKLFQDELTIVNNKLFFYERVLSPELETTGVKVYSFEVSKNAQTNQWDYQLVLMQSQKERRLLSGKFDILLSVFEGEELKQISLPKQQETSSNEFKFKYFQTIKGSFSIPSDITVDELLLKLNVSGNQWYKAQSNEERYDWRVLVSKDANNLSEFDSSEISTENSIENENENSSE